MRIFSAFRYSEWSLKRKLFGYMFLLATLLLLALVIGLFLFGRFDSAGKNTYEALDIQLEVFEKDVSTHFDTLAAAGIHLSESTTGFLEEYLAERELSFDQLNDAEAEIAGIQEELIENLRQKLLQENCSGIFVMLDATVNSSVANAERSRTGLYLQQTGYQNSDESILLYRGLSDTGKRHGVMPHRKWTLEFRTDLFPNYSEICTLGSAQPEDAYYLTDCFTLPGTSERAMLMVVPIVGTDGTLYGVCGYQVSESYFMTYHAQPTKITHLTCLLTTDEASLDAAAGLSCGVSSGYYRAPAGILRAADADDGLTCFTGDGISYVGVSRSLALTPNNSPYAIAVMMLKSDYDREVTKTALQNIVLWSLLLFFAVSCCIFFSRRYLSPILKGLEQIKSDKRAEAQSPIPEINDLFVFLAEQDRKHEESLDALTQEKQTVQSENIRLQSKFEQAQVAYQKAQAEYDKAQEDLSAAKQELDRLSYSRKTEIDPDDYQACLDGVQMLTRAEREIFEWYLEGKTANEILELAGIKQGTLKFHNHNILGKLGVSSRKQMLRYAALMKQQEQGGLL